MCILSENNRRASNLSNLPILELSNQNDNSIIISRPDLRVYNVSRITNHITNYQDEQPLNNRNLQDSRQSLLSNIELTSLNQSLEQQGVFTTALLQTEYRFPHAYLEGRLLDYLKKWILLKRRIWRCFNNVIGPLADHINNFNMMGDLNSREQQEETGNSLDGDSLLLDREIGYNQENHWYSRRVEQEREANGNNNVINNSNIDNIDQICVSNHETEIAWIKLMRVLKLSLIFNSIMAICHALLLIETFDIEFFCFYLSLGTNVSLQNFQDKLALFGCQQSENNGGDSNNNINNRIDYRASAARLVGGNELLEEENTTIISNKYGIYYYFLILSILDALNNLFWSHSRKTIVPLSNIGVKNRSRGTNGSHPLQIKFRLQQVTLLKSTFIILFSPKQLFQVLLNGLFLTIEPLQGSTGIVISIYNCINRAVGNLYNLFRVVCYLRKINTYSIINEDPDILRLNESATTAYFDWQQSNNNDFIILDSRVTNITAHNNNQHQQNQQEQGYISSRCLAKWDNDDEKDRGWSRWPIDLYAYSCELGNSLRYMFERVIMISQMICVKVTIFAILYHIESQKLSRNYFEKTVSYFCLIESFLAMYYYYNKYYDRYM